MIEFIHSWQPWLTTSGLVVDLVAVAFFAYEAWVGLRTVFQEREIVRLLDSVWAVIRFNNPDESEMANLPPRRHPSELTQTVDEIRALVRKLNDRQVKKDTDQRLAKLTSIADSERFKSNVHSVVLDGCNQAISIVEDVRNILQKRSAIARKRLIYVAAPGIALGFGLQLLGQFPLEFLFSDVLVPKRLFMLPN